MSKGFTESGYVAKRYEVINAIEKQLKDLGRRPEVINVAGNISNRYFRSVDDQPVTVEINQWGDMSFENRFKFEPGTVCKELQVSIDQWRSVHRGRSKFTRRIGPDATEAKFNEFVDEISQAIIDDVDGQKRDAAARDERQSKQVQNLEFVRSFGLQESGGEFRIGPNYNDRVKVSDSGEISITLFPSDKEIAGNLIKAIRSVNGV